MNTETRTKLARLVGEGKTNDKSGSEDVGDEEDGSNHGSRVGPLLEAEDSCGDGEDLDDTGHAA